MSPLAGDERKALEEQGWHFTDSHDTESHEGFSIITKGDLNARSALGMSDVQIQAIDDEGFERSGRVTITKNHSGVVIVGAGGWHGEVRSTLPLRAHAAVLNKAVEILNREFRLQRIGTEFPGAEAEARAAGKAAQS